MIKLIKMEMKKIKLERYVKAALVTAIGVTGLLFLLLFADRNEMPTSNTDFLVLVDSIIRSVFIVFSGVLIARLVIDEYNDKTIDLMFTYPIRRKKIMASKLLIVIVFTFLTILLSRIFTTFTLFILNSIFPFVSSELTTSLIIGHFKNSIMYDLSASGVGLIPMYFGMLRKSAKTTIIASVIIAVFLGATNGDLRLGSFIAIPLLLTIAGIVIAYLSIRNIEHKDVN